MMARMFDASFGVGEDPATGSAAGPLGVYLASAGSPGCPATRSSRRESSSAGRASSTSTFGRTELLDGPGRRRRADRGGGRVPRSRLDRDAHHRRLGDNVAVAGVDLDGEVLGDPGSNSVELV